MIKPQEWADWLRHPVTETVLQYLNERKDSLISELLNVDAESVEAFGMRHIAYRNQLNGLGEFLDTESLGESIVGVTHEN